MKITFTELEESERRFFEDAIGAHAIEHPTSVEPSDELCLAANI